MKIPLGVKVKNFLGIYVLTPFEEDLLKHLSEALKQDERATFASQLGNFTTVRRLLHHLDVPNAHGFTNFHTLRLGKDVSAIRQTKKFSTNKSHAVLATARVVFDGGEIAIKMLLVNDIFFRIEYRSPQKIYYPPGEYSIEELNIWPEGK